MYFSANTGNGFHIWRERFPNGVPEQVTSGPTEEEGLSFAPDGRSFVTSIGLTQSTVWIHDSHGERQISSQGYSFLPSFSADGKTLFYLVRSDKSRHLSGVLWSVDLESGKRERLLPDVFMQHYNVSADGKRVVFIGENEGERFPVWLATLDRHSTPRQLTSTDAGTTAYFSAKDEVLFVAKDQGTTFLYRIKVDGSGLQKVLSTPVRYLNDVSPDGKWISMWGEGSNEETRNPVVIYARDGGSAITICETCGAAGAPYFPSQLSWSRDQSFLYVQSLDGVYAVPIPPNAGLPPGLAALGFGFKGIAALAGAHHVAPGLAYPGPKPSVYAFTRVTAQRNVYRIPVP